MTSRAEVSLSTISHVTPPLWSHCTLCILSHHSPQTATPSASYTKHTLLSPRQGRYGISSLKPSNLVGEYLKHDRHPAVQSYRLIQPVLPTGYMLLIKRIRRKTCWEDEIEHHLGCEQLSIAYSSSSMTAVLNRGGEGSPRLLRVCKNFKYFNNWNTQLYILSHKASCKAD